MASPSSNSKLTLKLFIDTKNEKVLFAEASKPVIDFIFHILTLPLGTVVKLLSKNGMVGSIQNVYQSVQDLNDIYMHPEQSKDLLLDPTTAISSKEFCNLFPTIDDNDKPMSTSDFLMVAELDKEDDDEEDQDYMEEEEEDDDEDDDEDEVEEEYLGYSVFYACPNKCGDDMTCDKTTICSRCNIAMSYQITNCVLNTKDAEKNGFVKDNVTFLVMDDLVIQPLCSAISTIALLNNKFNINDTGALQEMVVELGPDEGIKLLKASLQSKMVLTSVFIKKEN